MSADYRDMLCALNDAAAEYLVVGAYALGAHGIIRGTLDIDLWVRPTPDNAARVWRALAAFGAPMDGIAAEDFAQPREIVQIGVIPNRIDILTRISGVDFDDAWPRRVKAQVLGVDVWVIGRDELMRNKQASGRRKDLDDLDTLRAKKTKG